MKEDHPYLFIVHGSFDGSTKCSSFMHYNAVETAMDDKEVGVILLTEKFGREFPDLINEIRMERTMPLLIEIPDRHGTGRRKDFITSYVNEAIGLKL